MSRKNRLIEIIKTNPWKITLIAFIYLVLIFILNKYYIVLPTLFTLNLWIIIPHLIFIFLTGFLSGVIVVILINEFKQHKVHTKATGSIGAVFGIAAAGCPACAAGLIPAILGIFGVTFSIALLPLAGLELQIVAILILAFSLYHLLEPKVCKL